MAVDFHCCDYFGGIQIVLVLVAGKIVDDATDIRRIFGEWGRVFFGGLRMKRTLSVCGWWANKILMMAADPTNPRELTDSKYRRLNKPPQLRYRRNWWRDFQCNFRIWCSKVRNLIDFEISNDRLRRCDCCRLRPSKFQQSPFLPSLSPLHNKNTKWNEIS